MAEVGIIGSKGRMGQALVDAIAEARLTHSGGVDKGDDIAALAEVPLFVLVDQFQEIYSLCEDKTEREAFIESLLHVAIVTSLKRQ